MRVLVLWENSGEEAVAQRVAAVAANVLGTIANSVCAQLGIPRVPIKARAEAWKGHQLFDPFRSSPEDLAAEAQRLLAAQEAAFGRSFTAAVNDDKRDVRMMRGWWNPADHVSEL